MSPGLIGISILVGVAGVVIVSIIAAMRKPSAKTVTRTRRRITITSPLAPAALVERLERAAWRRVKVADIDPERGVILLSTPMTLFSWGFFYPLFITPSGAGSTIEVGIVSRTLQWGPVVTNNHKACLTEIEQALL